ncbi:Holliday junction branch migration protein RuvA [Sphingomicrobium aestuariivivum]|uniref:Holliday junction branch migration protein RuvA n=1 Tax=Sphingomicrobium aestuariivivum TaxID=1582356 RepID=UPI001FD64708|nr:Holliday junction branch migration protein RuvA [Sphingomicrobium aestuariivivum]MCJ8191469.1 Holliday junction branch migration protein RuvA [Sphingomicrobium aestuariivivum]
MIARLTGKLAEIGPDTLVLDVSGVGYLVHVSTRTLDAVGQVGAHVMLLTEMQVREDAMTLYGFKSEAEKASFHALTGVQGVGGRVALAILSTLGPDELGSAIANGDKAMIARANGVGPKLAARICNELAGKFEGFAGIPAAGPGVAPKGSTAKDALSALANLGFKPAVASKAVAAAQEEVGEDATLDALVRVALKKAAK